jgi:hypothetical protein
MASRYEGRHHAADEVTRHDDATRYTVQMGDTLASIAARFQIEGGWKTLYEKNLWVLGGNPEAIFPGQRLALR